MKYLVLALCFAAVHCAINPLSADQAALVKASWAQVKHSEVDILYYVFKAHPDIQARFPQFVGKNLDSIKDTAAFATHAGRIVGFFSEVVGLLGTSSNIPAAKSLVNDLGNTHRNRGIPEAQFNEFRASLMDYVQSHTSMDDSTAASWKQATDNMYFVLFSALGGNPVN